MKTRVLLISFLVFSAVCISCQKTGNQTEPTVIANDGPTVVDVMFEQGEQITNLAQKTLGGALKKALQVGGVAEAIPYCNVSALPLTDSIGEIEGYSLRRTALRIRNPKNEPNEMETRHLKRYQTMLESGDSLVPQIEALAGNQFLYTRPILVQGMCTTCHGEVGGSIKQDDYALIQKHYPTDSAVNFAVGDLRGMWSVTFDLEKVQAAMTATEPTP